MKTKTPQITPDVLISFGFTETEMSDIPQVKYVKWWNDGLEQIVIELWPMYFNCTSWEIWMCHIRNKCNELQCEVRTLEQIQHCARAANIEDDILMLNAQTT